MVKNVMSQMTKKQLCLEFEKCELWLPRLVVLKMAQSLTVMWIHSICCLKYQLKLYHRRNNLIKVQWPYIAVIPCSPNLPLLFCYLKVCDRSRSPEWNEAFYFLVRDPREEMLIMKVSGTVCLTILKMGMRSLLPVSGTSPPLADFKDVPLCL